MITLMISFAALVIGYFTYGKLVERTFGPDDRVTPANSMTDGVDYMPMKTWRAYLVQLLNIAGTGPIFGALMGACFGPVVFLWIIFGSVLGGAVHDYMVGMVSERHEGRSIAELSGIYLGEGRALGHAPVLGAAAPPDGHGVRQQSRGADRKADAHGERHHAVGDRDTALLRAGDALAH